MLCMWLKCSVLLVLLSSFGPYSGFGICIYFRQDDNLKSLNVVFCVPFVCLILVFVGSESDIQTGDPAAGKFSFHQQVGEGVNDPDQ